MMSMDNINVKLSKQPMEFVNRFQTQAGRFIQKVNPVQMLNSWPLLYRIDSVSLKANDMNGLRVT